MQYCNSSSGLKKPVSPTSPKRSISAAATTYRIAQRLRELGFLEVSTSTAQWRLGREAAQLGVAALQSTDIMRIAPPILLGLLEGTREAVNLAVFDSDSMVLMFREQGPQSVTISSRLGSRRPMHASSLGKAYMAAMRPNERHALIERLELTRYTPETIVDKEALGARLGSHSEARFRRRSPRIRANFGLLCGCGFRSPGRADCRHQCVGARPNACSRSSIASARRWPSQPVPSRPASDSSSPRRP